MRKIIDVIPPQEKKEKRGEEIIKKENEARPTVRASRKHLPKKKNLKVFWAALAALAGIILFLWLGSGLYSKLTIQVKPSIEKKVLEDEIKVDTNQPLLDEENRIIPGRFFQSEENTQETFKSQAKEIEGEKAQGTIKVYNSCRPLRSLRFRANTRFLSAQGEKIFKSPQKVYLPPARLEKGKIVPGFKEIKVVAQSSGEDYNIGPSKFSVPGLSGAALYYCVWAESTSSMSGGYKKAVNVVAAEDLKGAKKKLRENLLGLSEDSLKKKMPSGFVFSPASLFVENFQASCPVKEGDKAEEFTCQGNMKSKVIGFSIADLKKIALNRINDKLLPEEDLVPGSLSLEFSPKNLSSDSGKIILTLKIKFDVYKKIREEAVLSRTKGLSENGIRAFIFKNYPQVEEIKCRFWPFWVGRAPRKVKRINLRLTF